MSQIETKKTADSDVTGNNGLSTHPAVLVGNSHTVAGRSATEQLSKLQKIIEHQQEDIDYLKSEIEVLKQGLQCPPELSFKLLGAFDFTCDEKFAFVDTQITGWTNKQLLYLSFGKRIEESNSQGGSSFILVEKLLSLDPAEAGANAGSGKAASISIGSQMLQATYINAQVNIGRTENNSLLVGVNNLNAGATPISVYVVDIIVGSEA